MDKAQKDYGVIFSWILILVGIVAFTCFIHKRDQKRQELAEQQSQTGRLDTVTAVAVDEWSSCHPAVRYKEVMFSHKLHLKYSERMGDAVSDQTTAYLHTDYNHPFYIAEGDECVVLIGDVRGDNDVVLIENLTKKKRANDAFNINACCDEKNGM